MTAATWRRQTRPPADSNCDWEAFHPIVWNALSQESTCEDISSHITSHNHPRWRKESRLSFTGPRSDNKVAAAPVFSQVFTQITRQRENYKMICVQSRVWTLSVGRLSKNTTSLRILHCFVIRFHSLLSIKKACATILFINIYFFK